MFDGASIAMLVTMTIAYVLPAVYQRVPSVGPVIVAPDHCNHDHIPQVRISFGRWHPSVTWLHRTQCRAFFARWIPEAADVRSLPSQSWTKV